MAFKSAVTCSLPSNETFTENGQMAYTSSSCARVDYFGGVLRETEKSKIENL